MAPCPWPACLVALLGSCAAATARAQQDSGTAPRVRVEGVYTAAQAERGQVTFRRICAQCHVVGQFSGRSFRRAWAGRPTYELFELIRTTMPQDKPGTLGRQDYTDVVAYFLSLSGAPAGPAELAAEPDTLRRVLFPPAPPPRN